MGKTLARYLDALLSESIPGPRFDPCKSHFHSCIVLLFRIDFIDTDMLILTSFFKNFFVSFLLQLFV